MGCWNKTCGLSNLPIYAGEQVYTFILEKSSECFGHHCYSTHLYSPILIPFYSEYDDYGSGGNNCGIGLRVILNSLKEKLIEKEVGENEYHDIAVKRDEFDEYLLFNSMREGRLMVKNYYSSYAGQSPENNVEFLMMKKSVVDKILTQYRVERYLGNGEYTYESFGDVVQEIDQFVQLIKTDIDKNKKMFEGLDVKDTKNFVHEMRYLHSLTSSFYLRGICEQHNLKLKEWMGFVDSTMGSSSKIVSIGNILSDLLFKDKLDEAKEFIKDFLKGCFIAYFMERARRSWIPQCGEGSQDIDLDPHILLAQSILQVAEKDERRYDDGDEDDL